jgi:hypothetical protein
MRFIKELLKQEAATSTARYRTFNSIDAGNYHLSIQGGEIWGCIPKGTFPVTEYSNMDLAIFNKSGSMINIKRSSLLKKFERYNELVKYADGSNSRSITYKFVPVDLLEDLYCFLKRSC